MNYTAVGNNNYIDWLCLRGTSKMLPLKEPYCPCLRLRTIWIFCGQYIQCFLKASQYNINMILNNGVAKHYLNHPIEKILMKFIGKSTELSNWRQRNRLWFSWGYTSCYLTHVQVDLFYVPWWWKIVNWCCFWSTKMWFDNFVPQKSYFQLEFIWWMCF